MQTCMLGRLEVFPYTTVLQGYSAPIDTLSSLEPIGHLCAVNVFCLEGASPPHPPFQPKLAVPSARDRTHSCPAGWGQPQAMATAWRWAPGTP